jgi:hypothetical protein
MRNRWVERVLKIKTCGVLATEKTQTTMKTKTRIHPIRAAAISMIACASAQAAVISDFSSFSSVKDNLLGGSNTITQTFSTTTGVGTNSVIADAGTGSTAGQAVYLSDSYSLKTAGSRISASLGSLTGTPASSQGIGLAVASIEAVTSRTNLITFYWRYNNATTGTLTYATFGELSSDTTSVSTATYTKADPASAPDALFIERTATGYILGSIEGVTETTLYSLTIGVGNVTADGTAVGIYSDARNADNVNTLINFAHVPEPSTALLGGLGALFLLRRRRS